MDPRKIPVVLIAILAFLVLLLAVVATSQVERARGGRVAGRARAWRA